MGKFLIFKIKIGLFRFTWQGGGVLYLKGRGGLSMNWNDKSRYYVFSFWCVQITMLIGFILSLICGIINFISNNFFDGIYCLGCCVGILSLFSIISSIMIKFVWDVKPSENVEKDKNVVSNLILTVCLILLIVSIPIIFLIRLKS